MQYQNQNNNREEVLRLYIEEIFNCYDTGRTGSLNSNPSGGNIQIKVQSYSKAITYSLSKVGE